MHQIRYFVSMAQCLNFTQAAERCNVTQPALTKAIKKLEEELGGPLFRREARCTHLTELGRMVRPRFEQTLSITKLIKDEALDFSNMNKAKLDLGYMCTVAPMSVMSLIETLNINAPQLNLTLHESTRDKITKRLLEGELDVAIIAVPNVSDALEATPLFEEPFVVTFPKGHHFEKLDAVPVACLEGEAYLKRMNCEYLDIFEANDYKYHKDAEVRFKSENEAWVQAMVVAGLGCAIMPESLTYNPELCSRPLIDPPLTRTISVVTRRGREHTPTVDLFVRLCKSLDWGVHSRNVSTDG